MDSCLEALENCCVLMLRKSRDKFDPINSTKPFGAAKLMHGWQMKLPSKQLVTKTYKRKSKEANELQTRSLMSLGKVISADHTFKVAKSVGVRAGVGDTTVSAPFSFLSSK